MTKTKKVLLGIMAGGIVLGLIWAMPLLKVVFGDTVSTVGIAPGQANPAWKDGVYIGRAMNQRGEVVLEVMIEDGRFHHIRALQKPDESPGNSDTALVFDSVLHSLTKVMLVKNSPEVDEITSATVSSKGIIGAVKNAVEQASKVPQQTMNGTEHSNGQHQ